MSLRMRASVFLALTILVLVFVFAVLGMRSTDRIFHDLDLRDAGASVGLVMRWLDDQAGSARLAAQDMAASAGAVAFVATCDEGFAKRELTDTSLTSAGADFVIFLNDKGEVVYARFLRHGDLSDEIVAAVRENPAATRFTAQRRSTSALIASTAGPVALGLAPVAARGGQKGDSGTTLITGRVLSNTPNTAFTEQTGLRASDVVDAYVSTDRFEGLVNGYRLRASREPNVILRLTPRFAQDWPERRYAPVSAIALDLAEDPDPRTREVGLALLARFG